MSEELLQDNHEQDARLQDMVAQQRDTIQYKQEEIEKLKHLLRLRELEILDLQIYRSEFLMNISHELRTPLNSILILSEILSENREGLFNEKHVELADTIHASGLALSELVNEALDFAALEADKVIIYPEEVVLKDLIEEIEQNFRQKIEEKGLKFSIALEENLPKSIGTDLRRICQVLKNCLGNALKFTEAGDIRITIHRSAPDIELVELPAAQTVAFSICDTGIGIPQDKHDLIFEAFHQLDSGLTRKYEGAGLGLAVTEKLVRLLGGEIHVKSEEHQGSTFTIYLPEILGISASLPEISRYPLPPEIEKRLFEITNIRDDRHRLNRNDVTVLIINDDPETTKILFHRAHAARMKCLIAGDGEAGLLLANHYAPDAIFVSDGLSSRVNGWKVMERLKDNFDTRHLPAFFLSSRNITHEAMTMGALGSLQVPLQAEILEDVLQRIQALHSLPQRTLAIIEREGELTRKMTEWLFGGNVHIKPFGQNGQDHFVFVPHGLHCLIIHGSQELEKGLHYLATQQYQSQHSLLPVLVYRDHDMTPGQEQRLKALEDQYLLKRVYTQERLFNEVTLFLGLAKNDLPETQQKILEFLHPEQVNLTGKRVLLADHDMRNVFALSSELENRGAEIVVAENNEEILTHLRSSIIIDVLLLNVNMPGLDACQFLRRIRNFRQFKMLPIIAMKANGIRGDRRRYIQNGASEYLSSPADIDTLLSLLRVWLY